MKQLHGVAVAWMCGLVLAACGGGDIKQEEFAETRDEALCHRQARCGEIRDEEACVRDKGALDVALRDAGLDPFALYAGSLKAGRASFDGKRAKECADLIRDSACEQSLDEVTSAEACKVFVGQRKDGEACLVTEECGVASYCNRTSQSAVCETGTCKALPGAGTKLTGEDGVYECAPGLWVDEHQVCQPTVAENGKCDDSESCAIGLVCDPDLHQCRRPGLVGMSCGPELRPCLPHLRCFEGSCRQLANVGMSCTLLRDASQSWSSDCKTDLFCDAGAEGSQGFCKARRSAESACLDSSECQQGFFCGLSAGQQSGTCQALVGEGGKCGDAPCAAGLSCNPDTFTCIRPGKEGEACTASNSSLFSTCQVGLACVSGTCQVAFSGLCATP